MNDSPKKRVRLHTPREVLLIEIERRCSHNECKARNRIGLTKAEAHDYHGFTCEACERRTEDALTRRDVPEWWDELTRTEFAEVVEDKSL